MVLQLNMALSQRLQQILQEKDMTQYQLHTKTGLSKSTIANIVNCKYGSVKLRVIHEICQGLQISMPDFFDSELFEENNLEP